MNFESHLIIARKIIKSLNLSLTYFIIAINPSQKLAVIAGICIYDCWTIQLGRSALQVLEILETAAKKQISVHIAKNHIVIDGSIQSTITATILGLAAQIEREFISSRTKEALAKRKADGFNLGRPRGQSQLLKLDSFAEEIKMYLNKGINKRAISKLIECSPSTLYLWLKRRKLY